MMTNYLGLDHSHAVTAESVPVQSIQTVAKDGQHLYNDCCLHKTLKALMCLTRNPYCNVPTDEAGLRAIKRATLCFHEITVFDSQCKTQKCRYIGAYNLLFKHRKLLHL